MNKKSCSFFVFLFIKKYIQNCKPKNKSVSIFPSPRHKTDSNNTSKNYQPTTNDTQLTPSVIYGSIKCNQQAIVDATVILYKVTDTGKGVPIAFTYTDPFGGYYFLIHSGEYYIQTMK